MSIASCGTGRHRIGRFGAAPAIPGPQDGPQGARKRAAVRPRSPAEKFGPARVRVGPGTRPTRPLDNCPTPAVPAWPTGAAPRRTARLVTTKAPVGQWHAEAAPGQPAASVLGPIGVALRRGSRSASPAPPLPAAASSVLNRTRRAAYAAAHEHRRGGRVERCPRISPALHPRPRGPSPALRCAGPLVSPAGPRRLEGAKPRREFTWPARSRRLLARGAARRRESARRCGAGQHRAAAAVARRREREEATATGPAAHGLRVRCDNQEVRPSPSAAGGWRRLCENPAAGTPCILAPSWANSASGLIAQPKAAKNSIP